MRGLAACSLAAIVVAVATCAIAAVIPVPSVSARPVAAVQWVDRTGKGDRIDVGNSSIISKQPREFRHKLLSGCEPAFSPLAGPRADNFTGRCTA